MYRVICRSMRFQGQDKSITALLENERGWVVNDDLNVEKMRSAASLLIGTHDFSGFRNSGCQAMSPIKTIYDISIQESLSPFDLNPSCERFKATRPFLEQNLIDEVLVHALYIVTKSK